MSLSQINRSAMSPLLAFPAVWALGALLSQAHLLNAQSPWSTIMIAVVCAVPISFVAGGLIGESLALRSTPLARERAAMGAETRLVRIVLLALVGLGFAELLHQFARTGQVPLLSGNIDAARFGQGGPTILLTDLLTVAAIVALTAPKDLFAREHRFELGIACAALGGFVLQAGRGTVLLPIVVAIAARWIYWGRPRTSLLLGGGLLGLFVVSVFFFLRAEQHPTTPFEAELFTETLPSIPFLLKPLIPIYVAITTNFLALQAIVGHFPTVAPFGHGIFDAYGINYFVPSARDVGQISNELTSPWVTSTVAGPLWADNGFAAVIGGVALTGILSAGAFVAARRTRSLRWSMVAAFLLYLAVFGVYTSLWTQHVDWLVIAPALMVVGAVIEDPKSPPGVTGQVLARVSGRFSQPSRPSPSGGGRGPLLTLVGVGAAIVVALLVVGAIIQRTLPEPIPKTKTFVLPRTFAGASAVMTQSDPGSDNAPLWWVDGEGRRVTLHDFDPNYVPGRTSAIPIRLPRSFDHPQYAIGAWPPLREPALFAMKQGSDFLEILILSTKTGKPVARFRAPLARPLSGVHRDLFLATYSGDKPDLYAIDRGSPRSRVRVVAVSGESRFRLRLVNAFLSFRGAGPGEWATIVGQIATQPVDEPATEEVQPRPDLLLVEHNPDNEHSIARLMLGENGFEGFAAQRAVDAPGALPAEAHLLLGTSRGATAIYLAQTARGGRSTLSVFPLQPSPSLY